MGDALKVFATQLTKNVEKQPGWVPLLVALYVAIAFVGLPNRLSVFGKDLEISSVVIVTVLTFVFYQAGDALDKLVFKIIDTPTLIRLRPRWLRPKWRPRWLVDSKTAAENTLKVKDGIYSVSKNLAIASEKYETFSIQVFNEVAKFLRSLVLPFVILGVIYFVRSNPVPGIIILVFGILMIPLYLLLKLRHIRNLYTVVVALRSEPKYQDCELLPNIRLFFWDGVLTASARSSQSNNDDVQASVAPPAQE